MDSGSIASGGDLIYRIQNFQTIKEGHDPTKSINGALLVTSIDQVITYSDDGKLIWWDDW
jgi:hypothetical protein